MGITPEDAKRATIEFKAKAYKKGLTHIEKEIDRDLGRGQREFMVHSLRSSPQPQIPKEFCDRLIADLIQLYTDFGWSVVCGTRVGLSGDSRQLVFK